jgi:methionyl-tRNA synthetase
MAWPLRRIKSPLRLRAALACAGPLPLPDRPPMTQRRLFVTTALPYANGKFHIGHIMEYIQADIWVRFQKMRGHEVHFVCADDAHGAPIMIAAEKAGQTPQQFVAGIAAGRKPYLDGFHIGFDNWHSTDGPENHELAGQIYQDLKRAGLIETRTIEQFFDPDKAMFLPDRFIKGQCPKCGAKDQYGDNCESCGAVYAPTELKEPYSALSGATPVLKSSEHFFFKLSDPRCIDFLKRWTTSGAVQPEVLNKITEWIAPGEDGKPKMGDWDISRDAPYFGIEIPDAPGKYFYVWLDAPIGYLASLKNLFAKTGRNYDAFMTDPAVEQVHFIGKDIITFHTLFWPAMLHFSGRKVPSAVHVHGFLTVNNGEKMSKSRGTGLDPLKYLGLGMNPEWLRYYLAAKLNAKNEDVDFNADDFIWWASLSTSSRARPASSPSALAANSRHSSTRPALPCCRRWPQPASPWRACTTSANMARPRGKSWRWPIRSTPMWTRTSPGSWPRTPPTTSGCTRSARCSSTPSPSSAVTLRPCCRRWLARWKSSRG